MPKYPYRTLRVIDGIEYVKVEEVEQMMKDALSLAPTFKSVREALSRVTGASNTLTETLKKLNVELIEVNPDQL